MGGGLSATHENALVFDGAGQVVEHSGRQIIILVEAFRIDRANQLRDAAMLIIGRQTFEDRGPATLGITCAIDDATNPMKDDRGQAHDAGFKARVKRHLMRPGPEFWRHALDGFHFGMSDRGIARVEDGITALPDDMFVKGNDAADRQVSVLIEGSLGHAFGRIKTGSVKK